ncbi:hypothetical protein QTI24_24600 [Variovorax sp. J22P240]|uniref:hypothetical protein n=1 Tax=Variovorax sp. J22P240 TaxID=3053514 RepID=UPI00257721BA|nr:hypothetical protein [Variovorax sp. J22P240]MDM0001811.1 hypothetical protein [Variovorax sp. J22P240]
MTDMNHDLAWTAPQPFWTDASGAVQPGNALLRPQILRFTNDEFINEMLATLAHDPASLTRFAAMEETWRGPGAAPAVDPQRWLQRTPARFLGAQRKNLLRRRGLLQPDATAQVAPTAAATTTLKLYQPAHMRHYLVGGSLVCRTPGLPDRQIDPARHKVSFVLRRLMPRTPGAKDQPLPDPLQSALWDEYAFVLKGKAGVWRRVAAANHESDAAVLSPAEERLSLFPAIYAQDDGHGRRLYIGSVPVGRREAYQGAAADNGAASSDGSNDANAMDPRLVLFHTQVLGPWKALVNGVMLNGLPGDPIDGKDALERARIPAVFVKKNDTEYDTGNPDPHTLRTMRSALQTSSWYLLLDLHHFLKEQLGMDLQTISAAPAGPVGALYAALNSAAMPSALADGKGNLLEPGGDYSASQIESNLIAALRRIVPFEAALEKATGTFTIRRPDQTIPDAAVTAGWPTFLFLFADPWLGVLQPRPAGFTPPARDYLAEKIQARIDSLADLVKAALPPLAPGQRLPEPTLASMQPADMREAWYVMRLVYERPDCAPFHANVVSAATQPFRMAGFFDPDAPARPIRIGLPMDISPAGLRKFDKNAVFMMSDMLCGQVDRMKGLTLGDLVLSVLPWPFHKDLNIPEKGDCKTGDGISLGVMCSLSIPIITICAMLLLMIIVALLDFVFRWIPYFIVCFPLPGFKGRKD